MYIFFTVTSSLSLITYNQIKLAVQHKITLKVSSVTQPGGKFHNFRL